MTQKTLDKLTEKLQGQRVTAIMRTPVDFHKGPVIDGMCGEDWESYVYYVQLESGSILSLYTDGDIYTESLIDEELVVIDKMTLEVVSRGCRYVRSVVDPDDDIYSVIELTEGLSIQAESVPGCNILILSDEPDESGDSSFVMYAPQCEI